MHMQKVELIDLRNLGHACRQCQVVRWIVKQRVQRNFDFMIMNVRMRRQPYGRRIRNEMNFVPAAGKLKAELSSHYSTAAIRGITGNPDLHVIGEPACNKIKL